MASRSDNLFAKSFYTILLAGLVSMPLVNANEVDLESPAVPGEYVVKVLDQKVLLTKILGDEWEVSGVPGAERVFRLKEKVKVSPYSISQFKRNAIAKLSQISGVERVEPNYIYRTFDWIPNDSASSRLWGLRNIDANSVWRMGIQGSRNIKVAVIDTGISVDHPDLQENIWKNPNEIPNNGLDDDQNGFIDDVSGWNFVNNTNNANDDQKHGSHCAGTIGAVGNNGVGVVGVNWSVSLIPIKFLNAAGGGTLDGAVASVSYAARLNPHVISASWGGGGYSEILLDAIRETEKSGALFIAAAGNSALNNDSSQTYPANYEVNNLISVAAVGEDRNLAYFSNYGKNRVHVAAPGMGIHSTILNGQYESLDGTSMATPHVSGLAALVWSANPGMSYSQVKDRILKTVTPVPSLRRKVTSGGIINAHQAILNIEVPRNEPSEAEWISVDRLIESPHPYENSKTYDYEVSVPGAQYVRVVFETFDTEAKYDVVAVMSGEGEMVESLSGTMSNYVSDYVSGGVLKLRFTTDSSLFKQGFTIRQIQYIPE